MRYNSPMLNKSKLGGTPSWFCLPRERWPAAWKGMRDHVCPLILALYGHPDAGGYWEKHCEERLLRVGFKNVSDWRSVYWHPVLKLLLAVYVDDFKMSGPVASLPKGWDLIKKGIRTDVPAAAGKYLGCEHRSYEKLIPAGTNPLLFDDGKADHTLQKVRVLEYDIKDFLISCVDKYVELAGKNGANFRKV